MRVFGCTKSVVVKTSLRKTRKNALVLWRVIAVFIVQTVHAPDEYWQSLEVAHRMAFGYGHLTWEWTWQIRSYVYPFLISILYRVLALYSLDSVLLLTTLPRIFQAILSAYADYKFFKWHKNETMLFAMCLNWYWYYCATRTLINSVETACTTIALTIYPWRNQRRYPWRCIRDTDYLWIVGFLCMMRPTAAVIWFPLCLAHLYINVYLYLDVRILLKYILIGLTCAATCVLIDSCCYGTFVITPWNFFKMNVVKNIGSTYGSYHLLWYIFIALPVMFGYHAIVFLYACWVLCTKKRQFLHREKLMMITIIWTIFVYSWLPHKEFRFILPLFPMVICVICSCIHSFKTYCSLQFYNIITSVSISINLAAILYFSLIHQRAPLVIMDILRHEITQADSSITDTLFLTPCHATPLYSHLHVNASIRFLTCEPNFNNIEDYVDEADQFFADPATWLKNNYINNSKVTLPTYVIIFSNIMSKISEFLHTYYKPIAIVFHTDFAEWPYGMKMILYKRKDYSAILEKKIQCVNHTDIT
ncbi:GPI mannosyltransferase 3 isoform X2 [Pogonomyrmex barbatus]|uniref:Mannosyltransferase n=1 Tax=Pogonomyrmex barbatus TaxID=144034 RepID=A0A6I9XFI6_9HYME|nr:GPI mannosyltransferase 3 isoform X2 [Pogonomyrmex barbatus]